MEKVDLRWFNLETGDFDVYAKANGNIEISVLGENHFADKELTKTQVIELVYWLNGWIKEQNS